MITLRILRKPNVTFKYVRNNQSYDKYPLSLKIILHKNDFNHTIDIEEYDIIKYIVDREMNNNEETLMSVSSFISRETLELFLKVIDLDKFLRYVSQYSYKFSTDMILFLLNHGADVNSKDNQGRTSLILSSQSSNKTSSNITVRFLLNHGADVNSKDNQGFTSLIYSIFYNNSTSSFNTAKLLLEYGADINSSTINNDTPLLYSINNCNIENIKILLDKGADINSINTIGHTSLIYAVNILNNLKYKHDSYTQIMELLLDNGANIFVKYEKEYIIHTLYELSKLEKFKLLQLKISKYIWSAIYKNIRMLSRFYANEIVNKDVWKIILLRNKLNQLERNSHYCVLYILQQFGEMIHVKATKDLEKTDLCNSISKQLSLRF